ncbi:MAG: nitroreductase family protein [Eubacteriales bacterium]|nr:nitroreductase family protein [Eubacteriales bacterium]
MDFIELAKSRYSVRKFTDAALSEEHVEKIVQAGILAPTAANFQPQRILVIRSEEELDKLKKSTSCDFGTKTSFIICYDKNERTLQKGAYPCG